MAENGPKNIANEFILTEAEEESTEEEKSWSDQGEEITKKQLKKKEEHDPDNLVDCLGCIMDAEEIDGINKTYPKTVCKRCKDWGTNYADVLEWMETCIGCVMCERSVWEKCPPNMVCDICKNDDGITYEEAKKWETGGDDKLYCFEYEEGNVDLVLTEKGEKLIDSFDGITFESDPRSGYGSLQFSCKSEAIDFLKMYRGYETGYKRYNESLDKRLNELEDQVKSIQSLKEANEELNGNVERLSTTVKEKEGILKEVESNNDFLLKSQNMLLFVVDSLKAKYDELKEDYKLLEQSNLETEEQLLALRRYMDIDYNLSYHDYIDVSDDDDMLPEKEPLRDGTLPMDYCVNDPQPTIHDEIMTEIQNIKRRRMEGIDQVKEKEIMDAEDVVESLTPEQFIEWKKDKCKEEEMSTETALRLTDATMQQLKDSIAVTFDDLPHYRLDGGYMPSIPEEPLKEKEAEIDDIREVERELSLHPEEPKDNQEED